MATGSPGGVTIIQFVVKTLVSALDWKLDAQQATSMVNFGAANSVTTGVGGEHPSIDVSNSGLNDPLLVGLRSLGHTVSFAAQSSGVSTIIRAPSATTGAQTLWGGADPRREGLALGDNPF
jgi:gamma-glutamyltranspeptidase/glutathione hydrolase